MENLETLAKIEGQIYKIISKDESNCYYHVLVKTKEQLPQEVSGLFNDRFFLSGKFLSLPFGKTVNFYGQWVKRKNWNFIMHHYEDNTPNDAKSIMTYLSSGLFEGLGKKKAESIVSVFGADTLRIIKEEPLKLTQIKGIGNETATKIHDVIIKKEELEKLTINLQPYNVPLPIILKFYEKYKNKSLDIISKNPYSLCEFKLDFATADNIAYNCRVQFNDINRIRAALKISLENAVSSGHCYVPYSKLSLTAKKLLENGKILGSQDVAEIIKICCDMALDGDVVIENDDGATYLPIYYSMEVSCAERLKSLAHRPAWKFKNIDESIKKLESKYQMKYAQKQKEAFESLEKGSVLVITGGPGTGKTTIIKGIIDICLENYPKSRILLCAPTGRAAERMKETTGRPAKTIHRLLECRPYQKSEFKRNEQNPLDGDVIIVDESSMIDLPLFLSLIKAIPQNALLIMLGDSDQLPSVGPGNILGDIIESRILPVVFLNEIFRQNNTSKIIINSFKINHGDFDLEYDDDFVFIEEHDTNNILELIKRAFIKELEANPDITNIQVLSPMRVKSNLSTRILNKLIQNEFNPKTSGKQEVHYGQTIFRKNDKVMQYRNNYDKDVFNGDMGFVHSLFPNTQTITVTIDNEDIEYVGQELGELELAYAITIHKSQGCEYDTVIMPLSLLHSRMLRRNLVYTGITRAKKKVIIIGEPEALRLAISNNQVLKRYTKLAKRLAA